MMEQCNEAVDAGLDRALTEVNTMYIVDNMATMTVVQARAKFGELLARAAYSNERTLVTRNGKPVAAIVSAQDLKALQAYEDEEDIRDADAAMKEYERTGISYSLAEIAKEFSLPLPEQERPRARKKTARTPVRKR